MKVEVANEEVGNDCRLLLEVRHGQPWSSAKAASDRLDQRLKERRVDGHDRNACADPVRRTARERESAPCRGSSFARTIRSRLRMNTRGNPKRLVAAQPGNLNAVKQRVHAPRL